ncbi:unnamed protein product [Ectocarpus sp. CCAP 1310/34]|nr:unnamed protein product [Ectocarpus sp. CCAP 1310/34]
MMLVPKINPALGKFVCRPAQGSADQAWKSFGFASARASSKRARAAIGGDSVKHAANQALAATSRSIEKTVASPTPEQAHVMGVESVVEGVEWNLSTEQLQAFRASGPHLLRRKYVSIGRDEHQRLFVAELSAIVRVASLDTNGSAEGARTASGRIDTPLLDFQRTTTDPANRCEGRTSHVDAATATKGFTLTCIEARSGSGSGSALEESEHRVHVPRAPPPLPDIASGRAHLDSGCTAASTDGRCYHQRPAAPAVYAVDLTHSEVDALVGPSLAWKDPFKRIPRYLSRESHADRSTANSNTLKTLKKEGSDTVRDLEATSWTACLDSLCRRLRATAKAVDAGREGALDGRPPVVGKQAFASDNTARSTSVDPSIGPSDPSDDSSALNEERPQQRYLREELPVDTAVEGQGCPVPDTAKKMFSVASPWDGDTGSLDESQNRQAVQALPLLRRRPARHKTGEDLFWLDKTILKVGARVPWGRLHRGRFAKMLFTVSLGKGCRGLDFVATSNSPTADPMLRGCWECQATDRDLARYLSPGRCGAVEGETRRRVRHDSYDPQRCAAELHERGELVWACAEIARKAFRLVMVVPGGVVLSLAGAPIAGGREVAWPQDVEEDRALIKASIELQRWWRGCISRKRTRWLRMEREGMRRLSRLREQAVAVKKKTELEAKAKLLLDEERRNRAQVVLATAARVQVARKEVSRRRAEQAARQCQVDRDVAAEREEAANSMPLRQVELPAAAADDVALSGGIASDDPEVGISATDTAPGLARLETVVTIDGTEVHLTAHVKEVVDTDAARGSGDGGEDHKKPLEMLLVAVDKKSRRSSRLSLKAPDIAEIVASHHGGGGGGGAKITTGVQGALRAVVKKLTVFNSRRKDLFILSYKGKQVTAPH